MTENANQTNKCVHRSSLVEDDAKQNWRILSTRNDPRMSARTVNNRMLRNYKHNATHSQLTPLLQLSAYKATNCQQSLSNAVISYLVYK